MHLSGEAEYLIVAGALLAALGLMVVTALAGVVYGSRAARVAGARRRRPGPR